MDSWKQQVVELHESSLLPEHCGSGWNGWQLRAARDDLIREHADQVLALLTQQGGDVQAFRKWISDLDEQALNHRKEGHQACYAPSAIPAMVVTVLRSVGEGDELTR